MLSKPTFYCDIDGVLLDLNARALSVLSIILGKDMERHETWTYSFEEAYGLSDKVMTELWNKVWDVSLDVCPGVHKFLSVMRKEYRLVGLSSRPGTKAKEASVRDLGYNEIKLDELIYVENPEEKKQYFVPGTYYVEDNVKHAANAAELGAKTFLIQRPWNLKCYDYGKYTRVYFLGQIPNLLGVSH